MVGRIMDTTLARTPMGRERPRQMPADGSVFDQDPASFSARACYGLRVLSWEANRAPRRSGSLKTVATVDSSLRPSQARLIGSQRKRRDATH